MNRKLNSICEGLLKNRVNEGIDDFFVSCSKSRTLQKMLSDAFMKKYSKLFSKYNPEGLSVDVYVHDEDYVDDSIYELEVIIDFGTKNKVDQISINDMKSIISKSMKNYTGKDGLEWDKSRNCFYAQFENPEDILVVIEDLESVDTRIKKMYMIVTQDDMMDSQNKEWEKERKKQEWEYNRQKL